MHFGKFSTVAGSGENYTTRLTATLVNTESNENAGLDEKREQS